MACMRMVSGIVSDSVVLTCTGSLQEILSTFCSTNPSGCWPNNPCDACRFCFSNVQVALPTIYDMCKAVDRGMVIEGVQLLEKRGGKSGVWRAES